MYGIFTLYGLDQVVEDVDQLVKELNDLQKMDNETYVFQADDDRIFLIGSAVLRDGGCWAAASAAMRAEVEMEKSYEQ